MIDTEGVQEYICARSRRIAIGHGMVWIAVGLNAISDVAVETSTGTDVVIAMNYVGMFAALLVTGAILVRCWHVAE